MKEEGGWEKKGKEKERRKRRIQHENHAAWLSVAESSHCTLIDGIIDESLCYQKRESQISLSVVLVCKQYVAAEFTCEMHMLDYMANVYFSLGFILSNNL